MLRLPSENKTIKDISTSKGRNPPYIAIFVSHIWGEGRNEERVKSQYYLWDLRHSDSLFI